jgi:N-alpha-acetyltransferase 40
MVKSKQLKILRKKFEKANKSGLELPQLGGTCTSSGGWPTTSSNIGTSSSGKDDAEKENSRNDLTLHSWSSQQLTGRLEECMDLFQVNMDEYYRNSSWGLNLEDKRAEWTHANARFLVLLSGSSMAGFCHYRFDYDDETDPTEVVLYVYELQIQEPFKRQGLGRKLMALLEQLARSMDIVKVMLTVFRANQGAMTFYQEILHYTIDDSSPSKHGEFADYEILSKQVL